MLSPTESRRVAEKAGTMDTCMIMYRKYLPFGNSTRTTIIGYIVSNHVDSLIVRMRGKQENLTIPKQDIIILR